MSFITLDPSTGEVLKVFAEISDDEMFAALKTADDRYHNDWKFRAVAERAKIMGRAAAILREKAEEYARYMTLEMGKLIDQGRYEVELSAAILDYYASHAEAFLKPQPLPEAPGSVIVTEPFGVIVAIEPWNFPYY